MRARVSETDGEEKTTDPFRRRASHLRWRGTVVAEMVELGSRIRGSFVSHFFDFFTLTYVCVYLGPRSLCKCFLKKVMGDSQLSNVCLLKSKVFIKPRECFFSSQLFIPPFFTSKFDRKPLRLFQISFFHFLNYLYPYFLLLSWCITKNAAMD